MDPQSFFCSCSSQCGSGSSLTKFGTNYLIKSFLELKKRKKIAQKYKKRKKNKELIQIYLTNLLYIIMFFSLNFSLLDPDSGGKMNADPDPKP